MVKWSKNCHFVPDSSQSCLRLQLYCVIKPCAIHGVSAAWLPLTLIRVRRINCWAKHSENVPPPFLTIILLCFVWWGIFRRQSWMLHHFNTCSLCIMKSALFAACTLLRSMTDFTTQMTRWLTPAFLYMKQIHISQGDISCVLCMCVRFYRTERLFRKIQCCRPLMKIVARILSSYTG